MPDESLGSLSVSLSPCQWRTILEALVSAGNLKRSAALLGKRQVLKHSDAAHEEADLYQWIAAIGVEQGWKVIP